jgi:hypothetical protein
MGGQNFTDRQGRILALCNEIFHFTGWPWLGDPLRLILGDVPERFGARPILTVSKMKTLSASLSVSAILLAPLVALFIGSLASENQRIFLSCRANGGSVDACLLLISGR